MLHFNLEIRRNGKPWQLAGGHLASKKQAPSKAVDLKVLREK